MDNFNVVAFYEYSYSNFNMKFHAHRAYEIMYAESGSATVFTHNEKIKLKKGQFIFLKSFVPHKLIVKDNCKVVNLEIIAYENLPYVNQLKNNEYLTLDDTTDILPCIKRIFSELEKSKTDKDLINLRLLELLKLISKSEKNAEYKNIYVYKAIDYIDHNFSNNISVKSIAKEVGLNYSYLERQFKHHTNKTINNYVTEKRIQMAKKLMLATGLPIIDIAIEVGYNSRQSFFKAFKKSTGTSPTQFLEMAKAEKEKHYIQTPFER